VRRAFLAGLTANALLLASSIATIHWTTGDRPVVLGAPRAIASATPPLYAPPIQIEATVTPRALPAIPVAPVPPPEPLAVAAPPPAAPRRDPALLPRKPEIHRTAEPMEAPRRKNLRDFRLELRAGVAELRQLVSACSVQGASFNLAVESVDGGVRVLDATIESAGEASALDVACAQAALRGRVIPASRAEPGRRWQMPLAI
jgi:hypothetical protein